MNGANAAAIFLMCIALLIYATRYWLTTYKAERASVYRYKLFTVRDRLIRLVVEEKVSESDKSFRFLYRTVNRLLPVCRPILLREFISIFTIEKKIDRSWHDGFMEAINHPVPEIRRTAIELLDALEDIILLKSMSVRFATKFVSLTYVGLMLYRLAPRISRGVGRLIGIRGDAYRLYRVFDHLRRAN